jgi:hypothetical protein
VQTLDAAAVVGVAVIVVLMVVGVIVVFVVDVGCHCVWVSVKKCFPDCRGNCCNANVVGRLAGTEVFAESIYELLTARTIRICRRVRR